MNKSLKIVRTVLLLSSLFFCQAGISQYSEKYRPQYHFSPRQGWVGDPDALVYFKNKYHLFWWGHATSEDLVHWKEMPYPMKGGSGFHYFSGSMVVDKNNSAGFGDSSMVAVYTMHISDDKPEYQALSYSNDGESFHFYENNPVLDIGSNSFRDPQVFWYAPKSEWIMIVTRPHLHKVSFYHSKNLKQWEWLSDFGPMGSYSNDWEVPDIFQLPVDGNEANKKWVLSIGQGPNRMQYFLGDFDGIKFIPDEQTVSQNKKSEPALWADYGPDFYAARSWRNEDNPASKRTTWMAWMGNWSYARDVPSSWGKGFESLPRDISLKTFPEGVRLVQQPVPELKILRTDSLSEAGKMITGVVPFPAFKNYQNTYELETTIDIDKAVVAGVNLMTGNGRKLIIGYDSQKEQLFIDRTNCTDVIDSNFLKAFAVKMSTPLRLDKKLLKLQIFVDRSSVEVFANDGEKVLSAATFQSEEQTGVEFFANGGSSKIITLKGWKLKSIW